MNFLISNISSAELKNIKTPFKLNYKKVGKNIILSENPDKIIETGSTVSIITGYLRDTNIDIKDFRNQEKSAIDQLLIKWPVSNNITGSFSTLIIDKDSNNIIICCELLGIYPLYYLKIGTSYFISNSIILIATVSNSKLDEAGIAQRCIGPEFSNFGTRTILENCKRLLPGQYLKFDDQGEIIESRFDNSLYQNLSDSNQNHNLHKEYWASFKKDVAYCLSDTKKVNIALSGGIDSRILIGAIPKNKKIQCHTFGHKDNYETKIASKLSKKSQADFKNYYDPDLYFPSIEILKEYTLKTESVQLCSWLEILENIPENKEGPLLLGELCEALPARNIKKFSSREFRQKNFFKYFIQKKDFEFEISTGKKFSDWKEKKISKFVLWCSEERVNELDLNLSHAMVIEELKLDLEELFERIEQHNLLYVELYDELFSWYTYSRMRLAKQVTLCNSKIDTYSPAISIQNLRRTSNIHPNLRLNYRFSNKLFREFDELKRLNKVPTSQAPLVPQCFPDSIKFPIWGIRSKIDSYLINRSMKNKSMEKGYRLFKSINWASFYQNKNMQKNIKDYFKNNHLGEAFYKKQYNTSVARKELTQWPFANIDIINACSLNVEIDIIKEYQK